jgi:hypothetical protein
VGTGGAHTVAFASSLKAPTALKLTMSGGQQLNGHIMGLYFYTTDGQSALIARLKDSVGEVISSNQIIYRDTFDGVDVGRFLGALPCHHHGLGKSAAAVTAARFGYGRVDSRIKITGGISQWCSA